MRQVTDGKNRYFICKVKLSKNIAGVREQIGGANVKDK